MPEILTNNFNQDVNKLFIADAKANDDYYMFVSSIGGIEPIDSATSQNEFLEKTLFAKKIRNQDINFMIKYYPWQRGVVYTEYDDKVDLDGLNFYAVVGPNDNDTDDYRVYKCLNNNEGVGSQAPPTFDAANVNQIYETADGYVWKYMYTIPTDDVLRFLSTNFLPINLATESTRSATVAAAIDGALEIALVEEVGAGLPNGTHFAPVNGDGQLSGGSEAVVEIIVSGGAITSTKVVQTGAGYTYGSVALTDGSTTGGIKTGLYSDSALTSARTGVTGTGAVEIVIGPEGGHGGTMEAELNAKRVMTNIRLTYAEGSGDFPVDNDFRRIGIIKDPFSFGTTDFATLDTLNGLYAVKVTGATADYTSDEEITQTLASGGTAKGTVVSWVLDSGSTTAGVLKYIQSPDLHTDTGVVRAFDDSAAIVGSSSLASGTVDTGTTGSTLLGVSFTNGQGNPEIAQNSGDIIYVENRRLITRAPDQIEDIKLVIEFWPPK